ncbi:MAG: ABC transporter ATP-binding protein [Lachnospiraceae bacterium]|nr:ABC transporter ATP-binding protein [Lachnospiraceae bacterium]MDD7701678.1 ABC transporter ATP-binding protein [Lachnospiraceae bacterium]
MSENIVKVDSLVKRYGENIAVDHFSLEVKKGEILGLLGPNGSGKTTTINCILSLLNYDKGSIEVFGQKMSPERFDLKRRIGVVPQNVAVLNALTVEENIDFFCGLYIKDKAERKACIEEALEFTGLTEFRKQKPKKLSGGLLRRLNIACGIAHKPELIFFDEPTVAVDPQSRNAILEGIRKMNEQGSTVIYTSHYMEEVEELCSRIVIMDHGKNEAEGTSQSLKSSLRNRETIRINMPVHEKELLDQIRNINHVYDVRIDEEDVIIKCDGGEHNLVHILNFLSEKQLPFGRVTTELPTLNDVFLEITGKELRD